MYRADQEYGCASDPEAGVFDSKPAKNNSLRRAGQGPDVPERLELHAVHQEPMSFMIHWFSPEVRGILVGIVPEGTEGTTFAAKGNVVVEPKGSLAGSGAV